MDFTHVRWSEMEQENPLAGLHRAKIVGELAMVAHIRLERGCVVPVHSHPNEQVAIVLSGRVSWRLGPEAREVEAGGGEAFLFLSGYPHGLTVLEEAVILDVFCPPGPMGVDTLPQGV